MESSTFNSSGMAEKQSFWRLFLLKNDKCHDYDFGYFGDLCAYLSESYLIARS